MVPAHTHLKNMTLMVKRAYRRRHARGDPPRTPTTRPQTLPTKHSKQHGKASQQGNQARREVLLNPGIPVDQRKLFKRRCRFKARWDVAAKPHTKTGHPKSPR